MAKYVYPAIFTTEAKGGYSVLFKDFEADNCRYKIATGGNDLQNAIEMAKDALCMTLYDMEQDGAELPKASDIKNIPVEKNEFVQFIDCDTEFYKKFYEKRSVRTTITIPQYLKLLAEQQGYNFSQVLQEALKQKLNYGN